MQTIKINIVDKVATAEGNPFIVCGNSDYTILFNFDKAWDGYNAKTARFSYEQDGEEIIAEVPFAGNSCKAPIIQNSKRVDIGVYAGDLLSTTRCRVNCRASILDGEGIEHEEPPEDVYNQMIDICNEAVTAAQGFEATTRETFANAIKGNLHGAAVRADDVSPVEHNLVFKVESKNLIPYPYYDKNITRNGITFTIDENDKGITLSGTATDNISFCLVMNTPGKLEVKKGEKYTLSCNSKFKASTGYAYLQNFVNNKPVEVFSVVQGKTTFTTTRTGEAYIGVVAVAGATFDNEKIYVQLERDTTATEYTPYIDPSTATVTRCGKNLIAYPYDDTTKTHNGITFTDNKDGSITINGTATAEAYFYLQKDVEYGNTINAVKQSATNGVYTASKRLYYNSLNKYLTINILAGDVVSNETIYPQLELGATATEYEPYKAPQIATAAADGTVEGITSLSPTMTLLTDTPGTVINCEYTKDTNKALTGNMVTAEGTVVSPNADFAEVAEWADGNPNSEDRTGYFVCANVPVDGIVMKKATSTDDVKGVTIQAPAFAGNYTKDKLDSNGKLLPKYSYVAIIGFVPVIDNGTCTVGGRCMPDDDGCAIPSSNSMGYQVVNRIDEKRVLIIIEPNGDMVQRVKTKINGLNDVFAPTIKQTAIGNAITINDVSPIEHELKVKVKSKNLLAYPYADTTQTVKGVTVTDNGDGTITVNGTGNEMGSFPFYFAKSLPLEAGTYFISHQYTGTLPTTLMWGGIAKTESGNTAGISVDGKNTFTEKVYLEFYVMLYPSDYNSPTTYYTYNNVVFKPYIVKDGEPTNYTPYIDLSTVNVSQYGKNLWNNDSIVIFNGNGISVENLSTQFRTSVKDKPLTVSYNVTSKNVTYSATGNLVFIGVRYLDNTQDYLTIVNASTKDGLNKLTIPIHEHKGLNYLSFSTHARFTSGTITISNIQIEIGATATEYEPYIEPITATSNAEGVVNGLMSISPNVTLLANKEVTIECEYNTDTKTYIDNKFNELSKALLNV